MTQLPSVQQEKVAVALPQRRKWGAMAVREALWGYAMIAPTMLGLGIFFYLALAASLLISFTKWDVLTAPVWVGLENYVKLVQSPIFQRSLVNTTVFSLLTVPLGMLISLSLALALNSQIRFRDFYRLIFFLPALTMPVAISVVWKWMYNPDYGLLNQMLGLFGGGRIRWLSDTRFALMSLVIMNVWMGSGYGMIIFLAGLQNISRSFYEAAEIDGASRWQQLRYITLPLLSPTIFFSLITSLISAFQLFDIVYAMTKGGPLNSTRTLVYMIYDDGFHFFRMGSASANAWILFIIILLITVLQFQGQRRWVHYT